MKKFKMFDQKSYRLCDFYQELFYSVERLVFFLKRRQRHFLAYFIYKTENKEI